VSESNFSREVRQELHKHYYPRGAWWLNSTGYEQHHDPFPCRGAGDLLGAICGLWCEIELKTATGKMRDNQLTRQSTCLKLGLIYLVVRSIPSLHAQLAPFDDKNWKGCAIALANAVRTP
jgi:hypothetical protein